MNFVLSLSHSMWSVKFFFRLTFEIISHCINETNTICVLVLSVVRLRRIVAQSFVSMRRIRWHMSVLMRRTQFHAMGWRWCFDIERFSTISVNIDPQSNRVQRCRNAILFYFNSLWNKNWWLKNKSQPHSVYTTHDSCWFISISKKCLSKQMYTIEPIIWVSHLFYSIYFINIFIRFIDEI